MAIFGELYDELYVFVFYVVTVNGVWIDWNRNLFCGAGVKKSWCHAVRVEAKHLKKFRTVFTKFGFYLEVQKYGIEKLKRSDSDITLGNLNSWKHSDRCSAHCTYHNKIRPVRGGGKVRGASLRGAVRGINARRLVICEAGMCEAQPITGAAGVVVGCEPLKRN